jgi:ribonuclease HIII
MQGSNSYKIDLHQQRELQSELKTTGFQFSKSDYSFWRATDRRHTLTLYRTGKLLIQGKDPERVAHRLMGKGFVLSDSSPIAPEKQSISKWIGTDESGKGDYFGPLVIAGVLATPETRRELITMGVRDSKRLSDTSIKKLATRIRCLCPHSLVVIPPSRYNKAYEALNGYGKVYRILAWGHARVIENILEREDCHHVVVDQFARKSFIENALMKNGRHIALEQRFHAEDDMAVAAASILAREEYIRNLESLSAHYFIILSPGASDKVINIGRKFVLKHGADKLKEVAKLHFITTQDILNPEMVREEQLIDFTPENFILESND